MSSPKLISLVLSAAILLGGTAAHAQSTTLVSKSDMTYLGSFHLPAVSGDGFTYGGYGLAFNAANNSLPGARTCGARAKTERRSLR